MRKVTLLFCLILIAIFCGQGLAGKYVPTPSPEHKIKSSYSFVTDITRSDGQVIIFVSEDWDKISLALKTRFTLDLRESYPTKLVVVKSVKTNDILLEVNKP